MFNFKPFSDVLIPKYNSNNYVEYLEYLVDNTFQPILLIKKKIAITEDFIIYECR